MPSQPIQRITVLLIEDNPGDARLLRESLGGADVPLFELEWVDHLAAGLERLGRGNVDIVLLDLNLPDSSGLPTFQRVRAKFPDLPIILMTGLDDEELALRAVSEGAQEYLVKASVSGALISRHIRHAIGRHKSLRVQLTRADAAERGDPVPEVQRDDGAGLPARLP